jgi:hypothetical protein
LKSDRADRIAYQYLNQTRRVLFFMCSATAVWPEGAGHFRRECDRLQQQNKNIKKTDSDNRMLQVTKKATNIKIKKSFDVITKFPHKYSNQKSIYK